MTNRWMAALCLVGALCGLACSRNQGEEETQGGAEPAAVPEVTVTKVQRADISRMVTLPGVVAAVPNQDVKVGALVAGRVSAVNVAEGEHVQAGQIVARLDEAPLQNELQKAEAAAAQARANLENAKLSVARNEDLLSRGIAARKEVEDARTANQVADAAVKQADADVAAARLQLTRAQVQSPISGTVVKRFVSGGEQVDSTPDHPLVEIANLGEVELNASTPPEQAGHLKQGQSVHFTSAAFPGKTFSGSVIAIAPAVDAATNSSVVRIRVANSEGLLRLGMFLSAEIPIETHSKALVVPPEAIYRDEEGQPRVYKVSGDEATGVAVTIGIETPRQTELLSGVQDGDTIILSGGYGLEDKSKVSVKGNGGSSAQGEAKEENKDNSKEEPGKDQEKK